MFHVKEGAAPPKSLLKQGFAITRGQASLADVAGHAQDVLKAAKVTGSC